MSILRCSRLVKTGQITGQKQPTPEPRERGTKERVLLTLRARPGLVEMLRVLPQCSHSGTQGGSVAANPEGS